MKDELEIPRCAWCGDPLPPGKNTGRPRRYCAAKVKPCRIHAFRARQLAAIVEGRPVELEPADFTNPDEAIARTLLRSSNVAGSFLALAKQAEERAAEARELGETFVKSGRCARPALAWRAEMAGNEILATLSKYFKEAME